MAGLIMLSTIQKHFIDIAPEEVFERAHEYDIDVSSVKDFRSMSPHYDRIEQLMDNYRQSHARWSALGGLTAGIGGFTTAVTFAGIDTISLSIQLYRLSERFAILNGFYGNEPLQKDKMLNIYFEALGINAVVQASLKRQLLQASTIAGSKEASENFILNGIIRVGRLFGRNISSERAGRLIPLVGGAAGAAVNYSFARKTSESMKKAYKRAYFETWHDGSGE